MTYKKLIFLFLMVALTCAPSIAYASGYVEITEGCEVKILKIVDRETMVAEIVSSKETAYIRMIGVTAIGSDTAASFLNRELLGKTVIIMPDPYIKASGRWSYVYIFFDNDLFNNKMLVQGHAKLNTDHWAASFYKLLSGEASRAEFEGMGMWADTGSSVSDFTFVSERININTASVAQLTGLKGIDANLAERIVGYRRTHPFQTVGEIKFVNGFTKELFDAHHNRLVVSTNVNDALKNELGTLSGFTEFDVDWILNYREKNRLSSLDSLLSYISSGIYNANKPFMDVKQVDTLYYAVPDVIVNINTADVTQLMNAGLEYNHARQLTDVRGMSAAYKRDYTLKTIGELAYFPGINFSSDRISSLTDNLTLRTDINKAGYNELMSLNPIGASVVDVVGIVDNRTYTSVSDIIKYISNDRFEDIRKHIYVTDETVKQRVNINTADKEQLISAGFSETQAVLLIGFHKRMKSAWDVPLELGSLDEAAALYTNVNKALYNEIMSLNDGMTAIIALDIVSYRENQPIGSMEELRQIFISHNAGNVYDNIKDYVVLY